MYRPNIQDATLRKITLALVLTLLASFALELLFPQARVVIGIASRFVLAGFCLVTALFFYWARKPMFASVLLVLVGIGLIVTALLGYSLNGAPPTPWL